MTCCGHSSIGGLPITQIRKPKLMNVKQRSDRPDPLQASRKLGGNSRANEAARQRVVEVAELMLDVMGDTPSPTQVLWKPTLHSGTSDGPALA
jgi:hypothetical protein